MVVHRSAVTKLQAARVASAIARLVTLASDSRRYGRWTPWHSEVQREGDDMDSRTIAAQWGAEFDAAQADLAAALAGSTAAKVRKRRTRR
jgi:hypothetical protein